VDSNGCVKVLAEGTEAITVITFVGKKTAVYLVNGPGDAKASLEQIVGSVSNTKNNSTNTTTTTNKQNLTETKAGIIKEVDAEVQLWRVYEMAENVVALPNIENENLLLSYAGVGTIVLFLLGGLTRIKNIEVRFD
jgi:hypothetical protein